MGALDLTAPAAAAAAATAAAVAAAPAIENDCDSQNSEHGTETVVLYTDEESPAPFSFPVSPAQADVAGYDDAAAAAAKDKVKDKDKDQDQDQDQGQDDDGRGADSRHARPALPSLPDACVDESHSLSSTNLRSDEFIQVETHGIPPSQMGSESIDIAITSKDGDDDTPAPVLATVKAQEPFLIQNEDQAQEGQGEGEGQRQAQGQEVAQTDDRKINTSLSVQSGIQTLTKTIRSTVESVSLGRAWKSQRSLFSSSSPPMTFYGSKAKRKQARDGYLLVRQRRWEWIVRCAAMLLSLIAFSLMLAAAQQRQGAGSTFKVKFSDLDAYNYLVAVNVITFTYFVCQTAVLAHLAIKSDSALTYNKRFIMYAVDQVLAFLSFSASSAAATAAHMCRRGLPNIWPPACSTWKLWLFCTKADVATAISFLASFCVIGAALFSSHHLSKLVEFI